MVDFDLESAGSVVDEILVRRLRFAESSGHEVLRKIIIKKIKMIILIK